MLNIVCSPLPEIAIFLSIHDNVKTSIQFIDTNIEASLDIKDSEILKATWSLTYE